MRRRLGIKNNTALPRNFRYWLLAVTLIASVVSGTIIWEFVNPISLLHRGLIFGIGLGWVIILAVFLFDLLISHRGWCGHICPVGAFYSLLGHFNLPRVSADKRDQCTNCGRCIDICAEDVLHFQLHKFSKKLEP